MNKGGLQLLFVIFFTIFMMLLLINKKDNKKTKYIKKSQEKSPKTPDWSLSPVEEKTYSYSIKTAPREAKIEWTLEFLMSLEWKRFEAVCATLLNAKVTRIGTDGGIDITISDENGQITTIGQCKAWKQKISVNLVREMYGIMASENVENGIYLTTSSYTNDAINFCKSKKIRLIDGNELIKIIKNLNENQKHRLLNIATSGDYTTPTCPRCDIKMVRRNNKKNNSAFWGCTNYPRCKNTLQIRK